VTLQLLLPLLLAACTGGETPDDTAADTDVVDDTDTASEPTPVWTNYAAQTSSTLNGVYASGEGVYVAGTGGKVYVGGAGVDWLDLSPTLDDEDLTDLWGEGAGDTLHLVAPGTGGLVMNYAGGTWTEADIGTSNLEGIGGSGPSALFAVSFGSLYAFDGSTWTFENPPSNERLNDVWGVGAEALAVGEAGVALRRSTEGEWSAMTTNTSADLNGVSGTSLTDVWAVGSEGTAIHFDGSTWTAVPTGVTETLWAVFAPSATTVYAVGNNGVAIVWNGTEWAALPTGVANNLYAVHGATGANVWAVGNRGMALQYKAP
jgi:hypothetical protein